MRRSLVSRLGAQPSAGRVTAWPHGGSGYRRPAWYRVAGALAATAAVAGLALAVTLSRSPAPRSHAPVAHSPAGPAVPAPAYSGGPPLRLVAGKRLVNGLDLGYPHSMAGAVSAAVEFVTELDSTLDPDRAAAVARLVADPSDELAPQAAAQGVVSTRQDLGLPGSGPLPPGTAVALVPSMFQVRDVTANQVTVLLLFNYTATVPHDISEHLGATTAAMSWTPAGWKLLGQGGPDVSGLVATPGTPAATARGWKAMTDGV